MKTFNSNSFGSLRMEINAALAAVGAKHGIEMSIDRITYTETTFRCKLNAVIKDAAPEVDTVSSQEVKWKSQFLANPARFGMKSTDIGRSVILSGIKHIVIGARPKANADIVLKKPDGSHVAYHNSAVRTALAKSQ